MKLRYRIVIESPNVVLCAKCVELGLGISIVSEGVSHQLIKENRNITFLSLKSHLKSDYIALVMRSDKKLTRYQEAFVNIFLGETIIPSS